MSRGDDDYHLARGAMADMRCYHWLYRSRAHRAQPAGCTYAAPCDQESTAHRIVTFISGSAHIIHHSGSRSYFKRSKWVAQVRLSISA